MYAYVEKKLGGNLCGDLLVSAQEGGSSRPGQSPG